MILYPAIDILEGKAVRLVQGNFDEPTIYSDDPLRAAEAWVTQGARWLHVVDLDGAKAGAPVNLHHIKAIAESVAVPIQCGGGLRSAAAVKAAFATGAARVVIGTAAYDQDFLETALQVHGHRLAVAVDVRHGRVSAKGWTESTGLKAPALVNQLANQAVQTIIYTNVDRDGMLEGPDVEALQQIALAANDSRVIYSGGIGTVDHLKEIAALPLPNLEGVIVGKALYENRLQLADAQEALCTTSA